MTQKGRVLYISHNGLTEPLGRRQVVPYLTRLQGLGWRVTVLSFEKRETASDGTLERVAALTSGMGIAWRPLRYHNRPPVMATLYDVLQGVRQARRLSRNVDLIHARSTVPALMARFVSSWARVPWIFDLRGLLAQEYVDAGHWSKGGVLHRATAKIETDLLRSANGVVTLTRRILNRLEVRAAPDVTIVVPCSVDLEIFRPSPSWRREVRRELGWGEGPVLVYAGSLGSWYRLAEMLDFYEVAREEMPGLRFLLLTPQIALANETLQPRKLEDYVCARSLPPDDVPRYLAAGDAGVCFLGRHGSKEASSPTKYGEYLAAGLPVVTNSWIGDASSLASEATWLLVDDFDKERYRQVARRLATLLRAPENARQVSRELAEREFALGKAVARYDYLYETLLSRERR